MMDETYSHTSLTRKKVARYSGYLDWASQPSMFKHYPKFLYRYKYGSNSALKTVALSRFITSVSHIASAPYNKLNTPSAGNLHPTELYVQIRGIQGVISGIYHVDAGVGEIVLIKEVEKEGIERYVGFDKKYKGIIFLISCIPFRSAWKYRDRAIRYCYLDTGHQVGAIDAALKTAGQKATILSLEKPDELNRVMGFREDEFISSALCIGELSLKEVEPLKENLIYTAPCDYVQPNLYVNNYISKQKCLNRFELSNYNSNEKAILKRRSSRHFEPFPLGYKEESRCIELLNAPIEDIECYVIVLKSQTLTCGLYKNKKLLKEGDFTAAACGIMLDQTFIKNASLINVMCSRTFDADSLLKAGAFAHAIALDAQTNGIGFSGIGAFYDQELQDFLGTKNYILYVNVLGVDPTLNKSDEREEKNQ